MNGAILLALLAGASAPDDFAALLAQGDERLTPREVVQRVWKHAPEMRAADAAVARAEAAVRAVRMGMVPRLQGTASVRQIGGFPDGRIGAPPLQVSIEIPRTQVNLTAVLTYSFTRLVAEVLPSLRSARARTRAQKHQADAEREVLALRVLEAYWLHAQARGAVAVARASEQEAKEQSARLRIMAKAGLATPADQAAATAREAGAKQATVQALGALATAQATLNYLLGLNPSVVVALPKQQITLPPPLTESPAALEAVASAQRPELLALSAAEAAIAAEKTALWGRRLPQISVQADVTYAQPNPNVIPPQEQFDGSWGVGAVVSWSPNAAWEAGAAADRLRADLAETRAERATLIRSIAIQIRAQRATFETARQTWVAARARIDAAQEAYEARRLAFENGRGIYTSVLEAEAELTEARLSKLTSIVQGQLALARLERVVGRLGAGGTRVRWGSRAVGTIRGFALVQQPPLVVQRT